MDDKREQAKAEVIDLMKAARGRQKRKASDKGISIRGDGNIVAGRDVSINKHVFERVEYAPDDRHIPPETAKRIQDRVQKLAGMETAAGMTLSQAYAKWYGALKNHFDVPSYKLIPAHLGEDAVQWLIQQGAIMRPKLRRSANPLWRNEHYKAIWAKTRAMGMSKAEVYHIVHTRIGKRVSSLKQLGERDLGKLYNIVNGMFRGAR